MQVSAPQHRLESGHAPADSQRLGKLTRDHLAVVIPARNESPSLRLVVENCIRHAHVVIVIDDASTDGTLETIADLPVVALRSDIHLGKGAALTLGFRIALEQGALAIVTLDGDGQHDPDDIPAFLDAANRHPRALIVGARVRERERAPLTRRFANRVADFWISRAAGLQVQDSQCGHRLYPRELAATVRPSTKREDGFVFESEILIEGAWRGFGVVALPIESRYPGNLRASHFRPARDIWRITCMVARKTFSAERPMPARVAGRATE